jgi:hypothetical protein
VSTNSAPARPNIASPLEPTAAEKLGFRKNARFSIGWELARSHAAKAASTTSPAAPAPTTMAEDQPWTGASMIAHSTSPRPATDSTAPVRSGRSAAGFFESGTSGRAHSTPAAAIGTLIRNTDPHQK